MTYATDELWDEHRRADASVRKHRDEYERLGWDLTPMLERREKAREAIEDAVLVGIGWIRP
jgi:hypothetical protein